MPNLDGTGPQGQGPLTGRRRGRCRDSEKSESKRNDENRDAIYGLGRGGKPRGGGGFSKGQGQGRRRGFGRNQTFGK
mgnify:CR=1 FL=1